MSARGRRRATDEQAIVLASGISPLPFAAARETRLGERAHLYFAYGADLDEGRLRRRCPDVQAIGRAALRGFSLAFRGASRSWHGATLTLVPAANAHVEGVLYVVSGVSLDALDRTQGCPISYERVTVRVADGQGAHAEAHAYCMRPSAPAAAPSDAYFDAVAREYRTLGIDPAPLIAAYDCAVAWGALARRGRPQ